MNISLRRFWTREQEPHYFHPAVSVWTRGRLAMTLQAFRGASDTYGPVCWSVSADRGESWSEPVEIPALGIRRIDGQTCEGVADVRPFFHAPTGKIIAIGCNTYYRDNRCNCGELPQDPVYAVLSEDGTWSRRRTLENPFLPAGCRNFRVACTQLAALPDGDLLIPFYLAEPGTGNHFMAGTMRCGFDGVGLRVKASGNLLTNDVHRGMIEPSVVSTSGGYYLTVRAEDGHGYLAFSADGLNWESPVPWRWEDGEPLTMSSTQQHWGSLSGRFYLFYTRRDAANGEVMRWRAPLYRAEFDPERRCLLRATEQVVFPLEFHRGQPNLMGNFHVAALVPGELLVSDAPLWRGLNGKDEIKWFESEVWISHQAEVMQ